MPRSRSHCHWVPLRLNAGSFRVRHTTHYHKPHASCLTHGWPAAACRAPRAGLGWRRPRLALPWRLPRRASPAAAAAWRAPCTAPPAWARPHLSGNARRISLWPAGSPEASLSTRSRSRLPQASVSLGQSAAWAVLAGHIGTLVSHVAPHPTAPRTATMPRAAVPPPRRAAPAAAPPARRAAAQRRAPGVGVRVRAAAWRRRRARSAARRARRRTSAAPRPPRAASARRRSAPGLGEGVGVGLELRIGFMFSVSS